MSIESVMPSNHLIHCHPLLLLPQSFPESGSFLVSQFFISVGQSIGVSASTSSSLNYTEEFKSGVFPQIRITSKDKFYLYMAGQTSDYPTSVLLLVPWIMTPVTSLSSGWHIYLILPFCLWVSCMWAWVYAKLSLSFSCFSVFCQYDY